MNKKTILLLVGVFALVCVAGAAIIIASMFAPPKEVVPESFYLDIGEKSIITNVHEGSELVKLSVTLEIADKSQEEFLTGQIPIIRHHIIQIVRSKTRADLSALDVQSVLSDEICATLNDFYKVGYFRQAFFYDMVMQ